MVALEFVFENQFEQWGEIIYGIGSEKVSDALFTKLTGNGSWNRVQKLAATSIWVSMLKYLSVKFENEVGIGISDAVDSHNVHENGSLRWEAFQFEH